MAKLVDLDHKWAHEIGRVFIAFGAIEHSAHILLRQVPADPIHTVLSKAPLSQKLDLLCAILKTRPGSEAATLITLLAEARKLADGRNTIAHNPLALGVFVQGDGEVDLQEKIWGLRDPSRSMSFDELSTLRSQAEELASRLTVAHSRFEWETREQAHVLSPKTDA